MSLNISMGNDRGWIQDAACFNIDSKIFDFFTYPEAWEALGFCALCDYKEECIEVVRPARSFYDGVCGGVVWRNGYRVRFDNSTREDAILLRKSQKQSNEKGKN